MLWNTLEWQPENKSTVEFFLLLRFLLPFVSVFSARTLTVCARILVCHADSPVSECNHAAKASALAQVYYNFLIPTQMWWKRCAVDQRLSVSSFVADQIIISCHSHRTVKWIWYRDEIVRRDTLATLHVDCNYSMTTTKRGRRGEGESERERERNSYQIDQKCIHSVVSSPCDRLFSARFVSSLVRVRTHTLARRQ